MQNVKLIIDCNKVTIDENHEVVIEKDSRFAVQKKLEDEIGNIIVELKALTSDFAI